MIIKKKLYTIILSDISSASYILVTHWVFTQYVCCVVGWIDNAQDYNVCIIWIPSMFESQSWKQDGEYSMSIETGSPVFWNMYAIYWIRWRGEGGVDLGWGWHKLLTVKKRTSVIQRCRKLYIDKSKWMQQFWIMWPEKLWYLLTIATSL